MKFKTEIQENICYVIENGTAEDAIELMEFLRDQAKVIDIKLGDPRHKWNRVL